MMTTSTAIVKTKLVLLMASMKNGVKKYKTIETLTYHSEARLFILLLPINRI